jgi:hypothetical protein
VEVPCWLLQHDWPWQQPTKLLLQPLLLLLL